MLSLLVSEACLLQGVQDVLGGQANKAVPES